MKSTHHQLWLVHNVLLVYTIDHRASTSSPTNTGTTKHDRLGDLGCDVWSCSLETRPEPDGTRRRSTADRESRMKSRASRSSCGELPFSENTTTEHTAAAEPRRHRLSSLRAKPGWYPARSCGTRRAPRGGPTGKCTEAFYSRSRCAHVTIAAKL